ncbi:MAG TPA: thiol:disulfide interchange protein [Flavobacteriales bacterium]|nr:thiol:disulfide interchange protein [Flavobacteriales bacterium]
MACDDEKCLPPELVDFSFKLKGKPGSADSDDVAANSTALEIQAPEQEDQIYNPVSWKTEVRKLDDGRYVLQAIASIEDEWHLYSMNLAEGDGPIETSFRIVEGEGYELVGEVEEIGTVIEEYDPNFMRDVTYLEGEAIYQQEVKVTGSLESIKGQVEFMTCDDRRCLPPEIVDLTFDFTKDIATEIITTKSDGNSLDQSAGGQSLWGVFLIALGAGLLALITPCVFPMVPMTVSFFTKQSPTVAKGKFNAFTYGFFIVLIYVLLSIPFHLFDSISPDVLNEISTNVWLNLLFFVIFIVFAISFFGAFEITMPSSWVNKADKASDVGGIVGIFFMAVVLVLVSFSCTGPVLGALLGATLSSDGGAMALTVGMLGFGIGLGAPFTVFALFPSMLNSLPKSGGWLNVVKVFLGFLELALAFKFLSNADLVVQAGIITREVFIAIWIAVFGILAFYLFGAFRLPHDSKVEKLSVGRMLLGVLVVWFTIYLIPGLWGAPLKIISGFPPPAFYSEAPNGVGYKSSAVATFSHGDEELIPQGADPEHCPHNLNCFHDYETGLAYAKEVGKPVMLDFTGWACVNCRKMEEQVWSDPRVLERLKNEVVLISLYVDERTKLPQEEQRVSETTGKKIRTIGNKWSDFQVARFGNNSQPYYVILDHEENQLHEHAAYDPDIDLFIDWLDRGVEEFKKKN